MAWSRGAFFGAYRIEGDSLMNCIRFHSLKGLKKSWLILILLSLASCAQLKTASKMDGSTSIAVRLAQGAGNSMFLSFRKCLVDHAGSHEKLLNIRATFLSRLKVDADRSTIEEFNIDQFDGEKVYRSYLDPCRKSSQQVGSKHLKEQVVKYDQMQTGFQGYKNTFYFDGQILPDLNAQLSDEPPTAKDRAIFSRATAEAKR
jgi:hypothetical protein